MPILRNFVVFLFALGLFTSATSCGEKENQVFGVGEVDKAPQFNGRIADYVKENLGYPPSAMRDSVSGIVRVQFVVNDYGKTEQIKVTESLTPACDSAVVAMVKDMPDWKSGTIDDFPVRVLVELPVKFEYGELEGNLSPE